MISLNVKYECVPTEWSLEERRGEVCRGMAYNVNIVCDRCGEELVAWKNQSITIGKARRIAHGAGWYITDDDNWYCQECGDTVQKAEKILLGELWDQEGRDR